jgi:hypothetical protein
MLGVKSLTVALFGLALVTAPAGAVSLAPDGPAVLFSAGFPPTGYQATPGPIANGGFQHDYTFIVPLAVEANLTNLVPHVPTGGTFTAPAVALLTATWYTLDTTTSTLSAALASTTSSDGAGVFIPGGANLSIALNSLLLSPGVEYLLRITGISAGGDSRYDFDLHGAVCDGPDCRPDPTPLPGAVFLFGSVLAGGVGGMQLMRRRRQKQIA